MDFSYSPKVESLRAQLIDFMLAHIVPRLADYRNEVAQGAYPPSFMEDLKALARERGLWNLFLPTLLPEEPGTPLTNLEYAPLAEILGRVPWASEVFNCSAPDTGNIELLHRFASPAQSSDWLQPLLRGEIRSAFCMTEPDVSSSDATNITLSIRREADEYVLNGRKWFITNAAHPHCQLLIVMGKTDPGAERHLQQSMVLVPRDTAGVTIERNIAALNHLAPEGHCEILFRNVRVPVANLLGEEGGGFAMAQARLGPGRIHHCMRAIGGAELALELMVARSQERTAFGKYLHQHGTVAEWIARSRIEIDQARLLVLRAAWLIDTHGAKAARHEISMIKALVPEVYLRVTDRAIQTFGAMGLTEDTPLAEHFTIARCLRFADGPDEVHLQTVAALELKQGDAYRETAAAFLLPPRRLS